MLRGCIVLGAFLVATAALADDPFLRRTAAVEAVQSAGPAVVNVTTERIVRQESPFRGPFADPFFDRFFQDFFEPHAPGSVENLGSGVLIDAAGHVLTNEHVVARATRIRVSFADGREFDATLLGADPNTDVAVLSIDTQEKLPWIKPGISSDLMVGEPVIAIGNPFGLSHTVTTGVISALERSIRAEDRVYHGFIQTDASINPGNSGGPLLNLRGEVIGINTAIYTDARQQGNIGIGFAIPSNTVRELLPQLRIGKVTRGRIGVSVGPVLREAVDEFGLKDRKGAVVQSVAPDSAASKAGLEPGDVIIGFGGKPVTSRDELVRMVVNTKPGTTVPLRIVRDRQEQTLSITVDELNLEAETAVARGSGRDADPALETTTGFGITLQNVTPEIARRLRLENRSGAVITEIEQGSPAARAGLQPGDVIVRVGRQAVESAGEAQRELARITSGGTAFLRIIRSGQETFVTVTKE
jgi:serine protease Do